MGIRRQAWIVLLFVLTFALPAAASGEYYEVSYPPGQQPGELELGVTYTLWVPEGAKELRTLIVHQHGCGAPACQGGKTAAYDLHWQALARKWDGALLGPSYHQGEKDDCRLWCDPRNGSDAAFRRALADLAAQSRHPELQKAPWCLWGHSGGGHWASVMLSLYPERIVVVWLRSGATALFQDQDGRTEPEMPLAVFAVPIMCNPGVKEKTDRFARIWEGMLKTFRSYRAMGAPIGFAPDPRTSHECGDSRYLAIPFFDACLAMRLPEKGSKDQSLRPVKQSEAWLAPLLGEEARPAAEFEGNPHAAVWLPTRAVARAWMEYVKTGSVADSTPPPSPFNVGVSRTNQGAAITWKADADFESGLAGFVVLRDGRELAKLPEKPVGRFGRPLFQSMSYHDTPEKPLPQMRYLDTSIRPDARPAYSVISINSMGLRSQPSVATSSGQSVAPAPTRPAPATTPSRDYRFDGTISRRVLENYLSRSITMEGLLHGRGDLDDNIRMLKNIGAKFIGRSLCLWAGEASFLGNLQQAREQAPRLHAADPEMILQACVFEIVSTQVEQVAVPDWVFTTLGQPVEKRNFRYADMIYPEGQRRDWGPNASVPDVSRMETKLWFFFQAASYIDVGCEAIHFGQVEIMNRNDRDLVHWSQVLALVRAYAAQHARRHMVLCDGHVPSGGLVRDGRLLLDFHSFPLRIMEVPDRPQEAILKVGFSDGIYGRSKGGLAFSGWKCEHLPYLVEIDNWGVSKRPGQAKAGGIWIWGYDEITWFAHRSRQHRGDWLRYAWDWVRKTDPNGYLQMPGSRTLSSPRDHLRWYYANTPSPAVPDGFDDEAAIRAIWTADGAKQRTDNRD